MMSLHPDQKQKASIGGKDFIQAKSSNIGYLSLYRKTKKMEEQRKPLTKAATTEAPQHSTGQVREFTERQPENFLTLIP